MIALLEPVIPGRIDGRTDGQTDRLSDGYQ